MSSAPASLPSSAASSEAFAQPPSVNHGVPDRLSSGLFQTLQQSEHADNGRSDDRKRERHGRKNRGNDSLNPLAKEFIPLAGPSSSGGPPHYSLDLQCGQEDDRFKGASSGPFSQSKGGQDGTYNYSVISRNEVKRTNSVYSNPDTPLTGSGGILSTTQRKGSHGQIGQRTTGTGSSSIRIHAGQGSSTTAQMSGTGSTPPGNRKGQGFNANHLLNFQYDPIPRPPPRARSVRRHQKIQPYNRELFLQANFRFLVSDLGDYILNTSDPDKMLNWEDVAAVDLVAPLPVRCPICLDSPPLCPQITTCGHIFCFPCILRYLLMGNFDVRSGDPWKKCPLCFAMICCKDLRTIMIDDVQQKVVGNPVKFTLLSRAKGSIIPFEKTETTQGPLAHSMDGQCHLFSKFTLTSDVEATTSKAVNELTGWAERVQIEGGEDLDLLPYLFVAVDQLQQRKAAWTEHRAMGFLSSSPPVRQRIMAQAKLGVVNGVVKVPGNSFSPQITSKTSYIERNGEVDGLRSIGRTSSQGKLETEKVDVVTETEAAMADLKERAGWVYESAFSDDEDDDIMRKLKGRAKENLGRMQGKGKSSSMVVSRATDGTEESPEDAESEDANILDDVEPKDPEMRKDMEERDSYTFYQSADGQTLILHPLNVKCLLHHYGSYDALPASLEAEVVELETITQSDVTRKRYRYLSHLPLTAAFQLCEVDLSKVLPSTAFLPFAEELRLREIRRRRILKQEEEQRAVEERTAAVEYSRYAPPSPSDFSAVLTALQFDEGFNSADFEDSLANSPSASSSPPESEERKLFSRVAKLGFASGYDAPDLMVRKAAASTSSVEFPAISSAWGSSAINTSEAGPVLSFADIIQAQTTKAQQEEGPSGGIRGGTKKGKKASKVLMSTAGGRRY